MEEESKKKMSKAQFWVRFSLWIASAVVAPVTFIAIRYGLFVSKEATTTLSGWGIFGIVIIALFLMKLVKQAKKGLDDGSMTAQCIDGYSALIPLIALVLAIQAIKNNIDAFQQSLVALIGFEAIAVPINPMRRWASENNVKRAENVIVRAIIRALGETR